jgi:NADPH:quinone reductase-like Zn-dependent oxidoreductase
MKAIVIHRFGPPEALSYEDVPDPTPGPGEARVVVHAATVNRVLDVAVRRGEQKQRGAAPPFIPGVDCAGVVDAVGSDVRSVAPGDRVAAAGTMILRATPEGASVEGVPIGMMGIKRPGGFAEKVCVPTSAITAVPDGLSFVEAAVVMRHCPTAWNLLVNLAKLKAGEWVLIMGASGNLGSVGIQIARRVIGARVIAAAGSRERADFGLGLGAEAAVDYSTEDLLDRVMRITDGRGVQVLYDNIANPKVLPIAFHALGRDGRLVTAGAHGGPNVTIDFFHLYDKRITIVGMPGSRPEDREKCFQAAADGKIKVRVAHVLPLSEAAQAHRLMESDPGMGKIVLDPTLDRA